MKKEVEKKYIVSEIPEYLSIGDSREIHQTYLAIGKEEVRLRKIINPDFEQFVLTIKKGSGLTRNEFEIEISKESYQQLLIDKKVTPLIKKRTRFEIENQCYDLDVYLNYPVSNLMTVEIEFESEIEASKYHGLEWFGQDITYNKKFKNQNLWQDIQQQRENGKIHESHR